MSLNIPNIKLNDGHSMPAFGLGTWLSQPKEVETAVKNAIDVGYRHIDGAMIYCNEKEVGDAIQTKIKEGIVTRQDLFLTSKLWNTYHHPDYVLPALKKTLADLQTDYLDLYLIHWPMALKETDDGNLLPKDDAGVFLFSDSDFVDTWKKMEEAVELGLTRSIGISNFNSKQIARILAIAKIPPAVNQIEVHPYWTQLKLVEICQSQGIAVTGYSPLGSPGRPGVTAETPRLLDEPKLVELGKKYGKSPAQIAIRWQIQRGLIVIPKTVNKNRLAENANVFDFELEAGEMDLIATLHRKDGRGGSVVFWSASKYYPFTFIE